MWFLLIIAIFFLGRAFHGCLKTVLLLALLAWVLRHDSELARAFWNLVDMAVREIRD